MDTMSKSSRSAAFGEQMAHAMAELRAIMASGKSPTDDRRRRERALPGKTPRKISKSQK
jgi:hypothetical protein